MVPITMIRARQILDSRGNPTVEVDLTLQDGSCGRAAVPSGASTGSREAVEIRDGNTTLYGGKGVQTAVANVNGPLFEGVRDISWETQRSLDARLCALDGTENKSHFGANAILGVSLAYARAIADRRGVPLYETLSVGNANLLPLPMFNVLNGGAHADNDVDIQEFMIAPCAARTFSEALRMGAETYHSLKAVLAAKGCVTSVGDEGGFAPSVRSDAEAIELVLEAITKAGYRPGIDIVVALDPAASELFEEGHYVFRKSGGAKKTSEQMVAMWADWIRQYPIASIEDGLAENDDVGWKLMTEALGSKIQIVGDDNFVTNPRLIREAIDGGIANAALIKLNQIGTLSETLDAIAVAQGAGYGTVISHRSGETSDDFIADLAVASGAGQIKSGAPARGERLAKYNQLLRIEEQLGARAAFAGWRPFAATSLAPTNERG